MEILVLGSFGICLVTIHEIILEKPKFLNFKNYSDVIENAL